MMDSLLVQFLLAAAFLVTCNAAKPECVAGRSKSVHPHESHCDRYYVCASNGTLSLEHCPGRELYEPKTEKCRGIILVLPIDCSNRPYTGGRLRRPACKPDSPLQYHPHENFCDHYYKCEGGVESVGVCPPREFFDERGRSPGQLKCSVDYDHPYSPEFICPERIFRDFPRDQWCPNKKDGREERDETDCGVYWKCEHGTMQPKQCFPLFSIFDPSSKTCKHPQQVEEAGKNCDMKNVIPASCPETSEWDLSEYTQPWSVPWQVQYYLDSRGYTPLPSPRVTWGHCVYYYECPVGKDGKRWPEEKGCGGGQAVEPHTLQCVDAYMVPRCQTHWSEYEKYYSKRYRSIE